MAEDRKPYIVYLTTEGDFGPDEEQNWTMWLTEREVLGYEARAWALGQPPIRDLSFVRVDDDIEGRREFDQILAELEEEDDESAVPAGD